MKTKTKNRHRGLTIYAVMAFVGGVTVAGAVSNLGFTCRDGSTCAEYAAPDAGLLEPLRAQCAAPEDGLNCGDGPRCLHSANGVVQATYDASLNADLLKKLCENNHGVFVVE